MTPDRGDILAALGAGSLAAIAAENLIPALVTTYSLDSRWAALVGTAIVYFPTGVACGLAIPRHPVTSSMLFASGALGLAVTSYYLQLRQPSHGAGLFRPLIMGVPLLLLLLLPGVAFLSACIGTALRHGLGRRR